MEIGNSDPLIKSRTSKSDLSVRQSRADLIKRQRKRRIMYQVLIFTLTYVSYGTLHATREGWSIMKDKISEPNPPGLDFDKPNLAAIDTAFYFSYSIGLFISGSLGDRVKINLMIGIGFLFVCGINGAIGLGALFQIRQLWFYILGFVLSGIIQSCGWPLCIALMGNWFPKKGRGLVFGVWSTCVNVGNIFGTLIVSLCMGVFSLNWGWAWIVLSCLVAIIGVVDWIFIIQKPINVGIIIDEEEVEDDTEELESLGGGENLPLIP